MVAAMLAAYNSSDKTNAVVISSKSSLKLAEKIYK